MEESPELPRCFYCQVPVTDGELEQDHVFIPFRNGGNIVVPSCKPCHKMKGQLRIDRWPLDWLSNFLVDLQNSRRETKIFLMKAFEIGSDAVEIIRKNKKTEHDAAKSRFEGE